MFPDIDLRFVGSVQSRNQHIEKSLEEMYLNAYRQHYPTASDADLMPFVRQQVTAVLWQRASQIGCLTCITNILHDS